MTSSAYSATDLYIQLEVMGWLLSHSLGWLVIDLFFLDASWESTLHEGRILMGLKWCFGGFKFLPGSGGEGDYGGGD